jgi:hypothetical protein
MVRWLLALASAWCVATGAAKEWEFVDIQPKANSKLNGGTNWWTGDPGGSTFAKLPIGKEAEFEGPTGKVRFYIQEKGIVLNGTNAAKWPMEVKGIAVGGRAKTVYFLHATGWEFAGAPSYAFVLHYDDRSTARLDMQSHVNSDDWCHDGTPLADKNSVWGWIEKSGAPCGHAGLITTKWEHPNAGKWIATMDAVSLGTAAVPVIAAVTLGDATLPVEPRGALATLWADVKRR